jgi:hypothetical protein
VFIAHARTDVPALLDEVERLREYETVHTALRAYVEGVKRIHTNAGKQLAEQSGRALVARFKVAEARNKKKGTSHG